MFLVNCTEDVCSNGGDCIDEQCRCQPAITGRLCETGELQFEWNHFAAQSKQYIPPYTCKTQLFIHL